MMTLIYAKYKDGILGIISGTEQYSLSTVLKELNFNIGTAFRDMPDQKLGGIMVFYSNKEFNEYINFILVENYKVAPTHALAVRGNTLYIPIDFMVYSNIIHLGD